MALGGAPFLDPAWTGGECLVSPEPISAIPCRAALVLLRDRRHLRRDDARKVWNDLAERGWKKSKPAWGVYAEP